jgi:heavy metal sensor kinase
VSCLDITGKSFSENGTDQIIDRTGFEEALNNAPSHRTVRYQGALVRVCTLPVVYDKKVVGVVQAYEKLSYINTQLRQLTRAMLWICPFALIFVAGIGAFLTGRALRPVRDFTLAAQKITAKSMGERLPVQGNDEFSELALTFNGTLNRLQDAYCRLEESLEQQRRLTADASHELRTPLTVIKAHTSLSLTTPRTKEQYLNTIRAVDQAADIMARIVQDLLLLARADAGQLMVEHEPVSVEDLIESSVQTAKALEGAPISINKIDPELIVQGDAHLLMRVALNVLSNAKRHTPEGGQIGVRVNADAANISIVVADTGEGIAPEHLSHIGERFYRVDTARERTRGGTGLGLAICKTIISAHNGSLNIESELGKGTTVTIKLPRAKGEA